MKKMTLTLSIILLLLFTGIASGMLSGLFGLGGGLIIVPALVYFLSFTQKQAQGTSLGVLLLPVGILAVMKYYKEGFIDARVVLLLSFGFLIGGYLGSKLAISLTDAFLKKIFALLLILLALKMLLFDKRSEQNQSFKNSISTKTSNHER